MFFASWPRHWPQGRADRLAPLGWGFVANADPLARSRRPSRTKPSTMRGVIFCIASADGHDRSDFADRKATLTVDRGARRISGLRLRNRASHGRST
jgi:hypothetical protein